jgi:hypothetical protein
MKNKFTNAGKLLACVVAISLIFSDVQKEKLHRQILQNRKQNR